MRIAYCLLIPICLLVLVIHGQAQNDSTTINSNIKAGKITQKYIAAVSDKTQKIEDNVDKQTARYLVKLERAESKIQRKLAAFDAVAAKLAFGNSQQQYASLTSKLAAGVVPTSIKHTGEYLPYMDSLKGSLSFLQDDKLAANLLKAGDMGKITSSLEQVKSLEGRLQQAETVKQFIADRKQQIKDVLSRYTNLPSGIKSSYDAYSKQAYYYAAQIREYKEMLNDPDKLELKALSLINQLPAFQTFIKEHSELAGLFGVPGNYGSDQALAGLQTKDQLFQLISTQMGGGANAGQLFGQQLQAAQQGLNQFKQKLKALGGGSGNIEMPAFSPNQQKTKPFLKRLEYGTNIQTQRSGYYFPTTSDIALSVGYKLNNKVVIGLGMSYKMGFGKDIRHIAFSSEGMGLRSYGDMKLKGSFYVSGGFEYNYQQPFNSFYEVNSLSSWSKSGLVGMSKIVSLKSKLFKKTKLQLLWDFLSYSQRPQTQAIKFRVGYNF
jgi:hypothetical protein